MNISFADISLAKAGALAVLVTEGATLRGAAADLDGKTGGTLKRAMKAAGFSGKAGSVLEVAGPRGIGANRILLVGLGKSASLSASGMEKAGGELFGHLEKSKETSLSIVLDGISGTKLTAGEAAARFAFGAKLRSYRFDKYKTKKKDGDAKISLKSLTVMTRAAAAARKDYATLAKVADGMFLTRDLVNEPPNILFPGEFAKRVSALSRVGLKVEVLGEAQMKKLGMGSLLGVGYGSQHESKLVVMRWMGGKAGEKPVAFVGKGVCFDTGGISLKPPAGMEDMKGDMGGAACVAGLMRTLATRKAKVNAVGVIGLVENMPDGKAQRPGDIVTSMSGQTIEVINTDAEGRLVLADALWYTQSRFKPKFMVDLATLTGAIMIALGKEYAGLFSNDDKLSKQLFEAGEVEGERVWRLPMGEAYDKMIESKFADMKNVGGRDGGSITAAQFLQRFVNKVPWAHLDIAGTAMASPQTATNRSWGSGWGVRLLDRLVADHYEG
ncbi:leucyl aminopeptidase [uncultured Parvibaculum sp.]|uniref:leucyl aminopeptidase n=1 Tax=uncultured Parvibaculum sp. TaxID=291828 RepID=UPI0030DD40AE|tara:strand:+ start:86331 stop:87824 length:1494 start_codon:yes stop_codon:yes gene_type:complete